MLQSSGRKLQPTSVPSSLLNLKFFSNSGPDMSESQNRQVRYIHGRRTLDPSSLTLHSHHVLRKLQTTFVFPPLLDLKFPSNHRAGMQLQRRRQVEWRANSSHSLFNATEFQTFSHFFCASFFFFSFQKFTQHRFQLGPRVTCLNNEGLEEALLQITPWLGEWPGNLALVLPSSGD